VQEEAQRKGTESAKANEPKPMTLSLSREEIAKLRGIPLEQVPESVEITVYMRPLEMIRATGPIQDLVRPRELTTLSAQEAMFVYFKVSIIAGLVIASPWVFWQIWSFIAAGLYPNEKRYVHVYLPVSVGLFVAGVVLC